MIEHDRLLTPKQAAEALGVTIGTLSVWRCTRRYPGLKYTRVGARIRYPLLSLQGWLAARTVGSDEPASESRKRST